MVREVVWQRVVRGRKGGQLIQVRIRRMKVWSRGKCDRPEKGGRGRWEADASC